MAFTKVAETTFEIDDDGANHDVTLPGPPAADDIVIFACVNDAAITPGLQTSGYTDIHTGATALPGFESGFKKMGGTPDTIITFNQTFTADSTTGVLQVWRGQDLTTPEDTTPTTDSAGSGMPDSPSITTITDGALVFAIGFLDDENIASSVTVPSGYGDLLANDVSVFVGNATVMIASKEVASAGAEDPAVFGGSGTNDWVSATFALRPAAAAPTDFDAALLGPSSPRWDRKMRVY